MRNIVHLSIPGMLLGVCSICAGANPNGETSIEPVQLLSVPSYCEGVVFDHEGNGYISHGSFITQFSLDGKHAVWAETGAPNGHKILADGTHLVCDASQHAVLHLSADGKQLKPACIECGGIKLRGPNDLSLDPSGNGFYFTDPEGSSPDNPIGTIHYVDEHGKARLLDEGLQYPNGIVIRPDGSSLLVAESFKNRILSYEVLRPGIVDPPTVFAELPELNANSRQVNNLPDGMCLDVAGNLYIAHYGMQQLQVFDSSGKLIHQYDGGNLLTSNVAFGGPEFDQLFVTGGSESGIGAVFRLDVGQRGQKILPERHPGQ